MLPSPSPTTTHERQTYELTAAVTAIIDTTPTPVQEPTDETSSSSGSSDQLSVGMFAGAAVGAVIGAILGMVFMAVVFLWRQRSVSTPEAQENQVYGTAVSTGPGLETNPAYGAIGMFLQLQCMAGLVCTSAMFTVLYTYLHH